ncbi:MAG: phenylalanine--tRNA ligase subunit beta [Nanoarchaeota archaeon]
MAIVTFSKNQFEREIGVFNEEMRERISMFGTPIEREEKDDISIEVFPNRPDMLSYHGFKRSFLAFLGKKTGLANYKVNKPEENYKVIIDSSVKEIRPYTACAIVRDLDLNDEKIKEIIDIQERLHMTIGRRRKRAAIGIYPLEKINLPITFKAIEPDKIRFIPLEMDKELSGLEILQRHSAGKEYSHLLAGKIKFPIFIDAKDQILSMPPVINSQNTGRITKDSKDMFIECSGFDLGILKTCLNIIVTCMADMGGKIYQMDLQYGYLKKEKTPDLAPRKMKISLENTNRILGININEKQLKPLLEKAGYNYNSKNKTVEVPAWRADILHEVDLIEDAAISYGYENFIPEIPEISTIGAEDPKEKIKRTISLILAGIGLLETSSYHLEKRSQTENANTNSKEKDGAIEVEGSKTEYSVLRKNLGNSLLRILSENVDSEYPQKIFEIGRVFQPASEKIIEKEMLSIAISPGNFTEARQAIEYLFRMLDLDSKISFSEPKSLHQFFIEGRTAEIHLNGKSLGFIGEVHPKTLKDWGIKMPAALFEIELEEVLKALGK